MHLGDLLQGHLIRKPDALTKPIGKPIPIYLSRDKKTRSNYEEKRELMVKEGIRQKASGWQGGV